MENLSDVHASRIKKLFLLIQIKTEVHNELSRKIVTGHEYEFIVCNEISTENVRIKIMFTPTKHIFNIDNLMRYDDCMEIKVPEINIPASI